MRAPTKDELAQNLLRAWYLAQFVPVDSASFLPAVEEQLSAYYGAKWKAKMEAVIGDLTAVDMQVPPRFRQILEELG